MRSRTEVIRKILAIAIGTTQSGVGILAVIVAYIVYNDFFGLRTWLNISTGLIPLYTLVLLAFGFFSITSGLFLLTEKVEEP